MPASTLLMTVLDDDYAAVVMRRQGRIVLPQDVPNPVDNFKVAYGGLSCRCARMVLVIRQWVSCDQFEAAVGIVSSGLSPVQYGFDFFRLCVRAALGLDPSANEIFCSCVRSPD